MMRVIPVSTLLWLAAAWLAMDVLDLTWLHWFASATPARALDRFWCEMMLILGCYLISGRKA